MLKIANFVNINEYYRYKLESEVIIYLPLQFQFPRRFHDYFAITNSSDGRCVITAHRGYAWDGASGTIQTKNTIIPSLFHDVLYQAIREGLLGDENRKTADDVLYWLLLEGGMSRFRAWYFYKAVRLFGVEYTIPVQQELRTILYNDNSEEE
jgi:hypothetical protein